MRTLRIVTGGACWLAACVTAPQPSVGCPPAVGGARCFVDAQRGNDGNPGTSTAPYATLQRAADVALPGDMVIVRDGVYTGGATVLEISQSGEAGNPIVFVAEHRWGAVIDGQNNGSPAGIEISGSYIRVEGFEIVGTSRYGIEAFGGSDVQIARNHVHDIGRYCTDSDNGIAGISAYAPRVVIEQNVVHDVGRLGPGESGCAPLTNFWTNHDHGVYHGDGDNVVVRNNVFYNLPRGWAIHRFNSAGTPASNLLIVNNTFAGGNPQKPGQIIIASPVNNLVVANNIFSQPNGAALLLETDSIVGVVAHNLTYGGVMSLGDAAGLAMTDNVIDTDPWFVNAEGHDFHLQPSSPAIGMGRRFPFVFDDFDRIPRPPTAPDVGAFQTIQPIR